MSEKPKGLVVEGLTGPTMPHSGHPPADLHGALKFIYRCGAPIECFDAFLAEYAKTKSLNQALQFARREWDL